MDFVGFLDDLDPFGTSMRMRAELLEETVGSDRRKGSLSESMRSDMPSLTALDEENDSNAGTPIKLNKSSKKRLESIEPIDNLTLGIRTQDKGGPKGKQAKKKKRRSKKKQDDDFDDMAMEDNRLEEEMLADVMEGDGVGRGRGRPVPSLKSVTPIPLNAVRTSYDEYGNEDIESSCDELSDSDCEGLIRKKMKAKENKKKKIMNESEKIMEIIKNKGLDKLLDGKKNANPVLNPVQKDVSPLSQSTGSDSERSSESPEHSSESSDESDSSGSISPINRKRKRTDYDEMFDCIEKFSNSCKGELKRSKICFGCMWANKEEGTLEATPFNSMMDLISQNIGSMALRYLAKLVHYYFKIHIRQPLLSDSKWIPMWRTADIMDHILHHTHDPTVWIVNSISRYRKLGSILENSILKVEKEGSDEKFFFDIKYHKALMENDKVIAGLYKMNPKELLFYAENYRVEPQGIGRFVNIHKNFYFNKS